MRKNLGIAIMVALLAALAVIPAPAQEGLGERIGEKLDRGLSQLADELREESAQIKKSVERMGVHGRVYSRLRWTRRIQGASFDIEVRDTSLVVLKGQVPTAAAKEKAVELAQDTVGVTRVLDELTVAEPPQ